VITGGSRGLGLVLARELVARGARVTLAARTAADLEAAREELAARGGEVVAVNCDVRDRQQVQQVIDRAVEAFGGVDVLFNVAGVIEVGPLDSMTDEDFRNSMEINCWGALNTVRAVLPIMRRQRWGRIVNVASLGGKRAVPHMLPYSTSKFALVGLSEGLRTELAMENILVTTICPSLMRTGSPRNATFKGQHRREYAWFSIGDALPLASMSAETAAGQILAACQAGEGEVIVTNRTNLGIAFQTYFPGLTRELLTFANRLLPPMGGIGQSSARGYESESCWSPSLLTTLSDQAARENNEMRGHAVE
jgi:NAD(P)-dependent dehydrogenase (short-subunit alcohol dehydrogenase family)